MARVPLAGAPVASQPIDPGYQRVNAPADAFGAAQAQGSIDAGQKLDQVGGELAQRALLQQQFDNERALKQADVTLADKIRTIAYGDGTAQNPGYYSLQGDNAVAQAQPTLAAIAQAKAQVMATLPNDRTRAIFDSVGQQRVVAEQDAVGRYVGVQRRNADNGASLARMDAAVSDAATRWNEPAQLAQSRAIIQGEVQDYAARNGLSPDAAQAMVREQYTKLLSNVVKSAGRVDFGAAQKILDANQDWLPGTALAAIDREMKIDGRFAIMQQEHAQIMADRAQTKAALGAYNKYLTTAIDPSNPNGIDLRAVANDPALAARPELKVQLYNFQAKLDKGEAPARVSAQTVSQLYPRIFLPDGDPNKITDERQFDQEFINGDLNRTDLDWLRKQFEDARTPEGSRLGMEVSKLVNAATKQIQGSTVAGLPDPDRAMNAYLYQQMVSETISKARQNGQDPREYLNPASSKYLGSAQVISRYQRSLADILKDMATSVSRPSGPAVGGPPSPAPKAPSVEVPIPEPEYKTTGDVVTAYKAHRITREQAAKVLRDKFGVK